MIGDITREAPESKVAQCHEDTVEISKVGVIRTAAKRCIGNIYGKLRVIDVSWEKGSGTTLGSYVLCICECGNKKIMKASYLEEGYQSSCGCISGNNITFGVKFPAKRATGHILYNVWMDMNRRCFTKSRPEYKYYGGRGITVCESWKRATEYGFLSFLSDMEHSFEIGLELERVDTNGDYEPNNCIWASRKAQVNNTRTNRVLSGFGIKLSVAEWGHLLGFNCKMLGDRINKGKDARPLEVILADTFRDRGYTLLYKGMVCNASEVWELEGYTSSQKRCKVYKYGGQLPAFEAEGISVEVIKPREKDYRSFEEGLMFLGEDKDTYSQYLLQKIKLQQGVSINDI